MADSPPQKKRKADSPSQRKRRGRKPTPKDVEARLQRSRQSARECRARKKIKYKSLEDIIANKEAENLKLRNELEDVGRLSVPIFTRYLGPSLWLVS